MIFRRDQKLLLRCCFEDWRGSLFKSLLPYLLDLSFPLHSFTMLSLPRSRRWVLPALILLMLVLVYRSIIPVPASAKAAIHFRSRQQVQYGIKISQQIVDDHPVSIQGFFPAHRWLTHSFYYNYSRSPDERSNPYLETLLRCRQKPNPFTNHIRLPNVIQNISQHISPNLSYTEQYFNPTIISLPPWSPHQYLLVSRVVTEGLHQESLLCEADICHPGIGSEDWRPRETECTKDDLSILGPSGGLRCTTPPKIISIPPTPAEKCEGSWSSFPNIPGFHDPRIFWSGRGEPLIMVNSASRYACVGLWIMDLRALHKPLEGLLASQLGQPGGQGPLMSYPSLTELTRNPPSTRAAVEKNWLLFFPSPEQAFIHYDLSLPSVVEQVDGSGRKANRTVGGRTFAKLIGNGFTTPNLTDPDEAPCLQNRPDAKGRHGHWHQASNALKLILCSRADAERGLCDGDHEDQGRHVHFAVIHRKFSNQYKLPLRYERFFAVWDSRPPFRMLGISRYPILMWNETATGWDGAENWAEESEAEVEHGRIPSGHRGGRSNYSSSSASKEGEGEEGRGEETTPPTLQRSKRSTLNSTSSDTNYQNLWAYFTYTPSIAWAFRASPSIRNRHYNARGGGGGRDGEEEDDEQEEEDADGEGSRSSHGHHHHRTLTALNAGYLDDELIIGIGVDDVGQGFARVRAEQALGCLRVCEEYEEYKW